MFVNSWLLSRSCWNEDSMQPGIWSVHWQVLIWSSEDNVLQSRLAIQHRVGYPHPWWSIPAKSDRIQIDHSDTLTHWWHSHWWSVSSPRTLQHVDWRSLGSNHQSSEPQMPQKKKNINSNNMTLNTLISGRGGKGHQCWFVEDVSYLLSIV